jgi:hypothetical protein
MIPSKTYRKILLLVLGIWLALASAPTMKAGVQKEVACKRQLIEQVASRWIHN